MRKSETEQAINARFPEGVAMIVSQDENGKVNLAPAGWFMICNSHPICWAVSISRKHYSYEVINKTGEFVLCLPSFEQKDDVLYCGSVHGDQVEKLAKTKLKTQPATSVKPPLIKGSRACFECRVINALDLPDHTVFVGEILAAYVDDQKQKLYNRGGCDLFAW